MPTITIDKRIWDTEFLTGLNLSAPECSEGLILDVRKGTVNSVAIGAILKILDRCKTLGIKVEIITHDDLSFNSLKCVGINRLATLSLKSASK